MNNYQRWKDIMKCYPFEEKRLSKWRPPYIVQPKYDGVRCRAIKDNPNSSFILLSSEGNIIFSVPHLNRILDDRIKTPCELDGELYTHGLSFEQIISITSRDVNIHSDHTKIQYHIFDIVTTEPQAKRILDINNFKNLSPWLIVAPYFICESLDEVLKAYDTVVSQNYEGIIVRNIEGYYERKRSTLVMKFKPKEEDSYVICGFQEEIDKDGTPKDTLGALTCASGDGNLFNVGTGFTAEQRKQMWESRSLLVGHSAVVKYQHITTGNRVPRFPVFVEVKWEV
jgi:DNA ligase 1